LERRALLRCALHAGAPEVLSARAGTSFLFWPSQPKDGNQGQIKHCSITYLTISKAKTKPRTHSIAAATSCKGGLEFFPQQHFFSILKLNTSDQRRPACAIRESKFLKYSFTHILRIAKNCRSSYQQSI
jgi:hypothetical protein